MEDMGNYGYTLFRTIPFDETSWLLAQISFAGRHFVSPLSWNMAAHLPRHQTKSVRVLSIHLGWNETARRAESGCKSLELMLMLK